MGLCWCVVPYHAKFWISQWKQNGLKRLMGMGYWLGIEPITKKSRRMNQSLWTNDIQWQCWGNFCINTYQHQWFFHKQWRQYASMVDRGAKVQLWSRHRCQQLLRQNIWLCLVAMSPWDTGDLAFKAGRSGSCFKRSQKGRHVQIHITHINAS